MLNTYGETRTVLTNTHIDRLGIDDIGADKRYTPTVRSDEVKVYKLNGDGTRTFLRTEYPGQPRKMEIFQPRKRRREL